VVRLDGVGGMTYFVKRGDEPIRPVIFVKIGGGSGKREDIKTAVKELSLLHELGHVDDFIKQINIKEDAQNDPVAAELYAHSFACKEMLGRGLKLAMKVYLTQAIPQFAAVGCEANRQAAQMFQSSREFKTYLAFCADAR
jgi:hypothetical protein